MSDMNDKQETADAYWQLAGRLLDLWQEQMTLMAQDPEYQSIARAWNSQFQTGDGLTNPFLAFPFTFPGQGQDEHPPASAAPPPAGRGQEDGATPPAPPSDSRDDTLRELARTLEQLNQRLERLETGDAAPKPRGKGGKPRK